MKHPIHFIKKHRKRLFVLLPIIILLVIFWPRPGKPVETQTVRRTNIVESLTATGTVYAMTSVDLNFLTSGKLVYLGAKKGDHVQPGQTIAVLDQRTVQKNLETSLRTYAEQRNTFDQTKDNNQNRTPEQSLNDAMKRVLQNNQYDLEKAVISVELLDLAKQQAILASPIAGVITRADVVSTGVNVGTTTTFTIADPNNLTFKIDIDEADIGKVIIGQKVKLTLDAFSDQTIAATVKTIDFAAHTTSTGGNAYTVEVALPTNATSKYRIGMNGDAEIITNEKNHVLGAALSSITDDQYVYVKTPQGFAKRKVRVGLKNDTDAEIVSGIQEGEAVALDTTEAENSLKNKKRFFFL